MIYLEDKPSGAGFPLVVILIAMAAIVGALVINAGQATTSARVWVPVSSGPSVAAAAAIVRPDQREIASMIAPNN